MPSLSSQPGPADGTTPAELLRAREVSDPARPLLTAYDDGTGERVELSCLTFANWVAKTANLLQDELAAGPGSRVRVDLAAHWQSAVWVLACWSLGAVVETPGGPAGPAPDVAVAGPDGLGDADASGAADVVALSLRPMGAPWPRALPAGVVDYAAVVLGQGDRFVPYVPVTPDLPALADGAHLHTLGGLVDLATRAAADLRLPTGARLLTDAAPTTVTGALQVLLLPLVVGGSAVLVRDTDPARDLRRAATERVSHDLRGDAGVAGLGLPSR